MSNLFDAFEIEGLVDSLWYDLEHNSFDFIKIDGMWVGFLRDKSHLLMIQQSTHDSYFINLYHNIFCNNTNTLQEDFESIDDFRHIYSNNYDSLIKDYTNFITSVLSI